MYSLTFTLFIITKVFKKIQIKEIKLAQNDPADSDTDYYSISYLVKSIG